MSYYFSGLCTINSYIFTRPGHPLLFSRFANRLTATFFHGSLSLKRYFFKFPGSLVTKLIQKKTVVRYWKFALSLIKTPKMGRGTTKKSRGYKNIREPYENKLF